jgi:predicted phage terminase large subunit-like protein
MMLATSGNFRLLDALCRTDFVSFCRKAFHTLAPSASLQMNFHIYAVAFHLELVRIGVIKRLIINLPPRSLKSIIGSVAFPAFVLGHDPTKQMITISYDLNLSAKHARDFRALVNSAFYRRLFPLTQSERDTELEFLTSQRGFRLATSVDSTLTGLGCDIVLFDDPQSAIGAQSESRLLRDYDWYVSNFPHRLNDKRTGALVFITQRLDADDLVGRLLQSGEPWTILKIPAIAEREERIQIGPNRYHIRRPGDVLHAEREPLSVLEPMRTLHPEHFAAQYQQAPLLPGGMIIQRKWVRYYDVLPLRTASSIIVQSWDCASKAGDINDWSVCTTWLVQDGEYYLMDVLRERLTYSKLKERVLAQAQAYNPNKIVVEDAGAGTQLIAELAQVRAPIVAVKPKGSKVDRLRGHAAKFEAGLVLFPRQALWLADYQAELFTFPKVNFDDQVDSTTQALAVDPSGYDIHAMAQGMGRLVENLAWERYISLLNSIRPRSLY